MRLTREHIQQFIDVIYSENKTIVLTAPAGFGKLHVFIKPIVEDLLTSTKKCLIVTDTMFMVDNIQDNYFGYLESISNKGISYIENRSKNSVQFKNGSVIDYKIVKETRGMSNEYDILFIDVFSNVSIQLNGNVRYLFSGNKKVIVTEYMFTHMQNMGDYPADGIKKMIKNPNPFYALNINKYQEDLSTEIRRMKLKKIMKNV